MSLNKANRIELCEIYIDSLKRQSEQEDALSAALSLLCEDNMLFGVSRTVSDGFASVMISVLGKFDYDWIDWYMWETDFGTKDFEFTVDGKEYVVSKMTLREFLSIVISQEVSQ